MTPPPLAEPPLPARGTPPPVAAPDVRAGWVEPEFTRLRTQLLVKFRWWVSPTPSLTLLGLVVFAMWYAAISQANSVAYLIAFTIGSMAAISELQGALMLRRLEILPGPNEPIFSGDPFTQTFHLRNLSSGQKLGVFMGFVPHRGWDHVEAVPLGVVEPQGKCQVLLQARVEGRGRHPLAGVVVQTVFPLGILRLSRWVPVEGQVLVYPRPAGTLPLPPGLPNARSSHGEQDHGSRGEGDNFSGLRAYRMGDSQRHVDWKAVARGQPMLIKEFVGSGVHYVWLDSRDLPANLGREARLSQLAKWIQECEAAGLDYGLRLPHTYEPPGAGPAHYHRCLTLLALAPR